MTFFASRARSSGSLLSGPVLRKGRSSRRHPVTSIGFFRITEPPRVTLSIITANIVVFILMRMPANAALFENIVLSPHNLFVQRNFLSIIASGFMHKDITHLLLNMLGILIFGSIVEGRFGPLKTLMIYFGALAISMTSSLAIYTFIISRNVAIIGASGALMGLVSCAMLTAPFLITYETLVPIPVMIKGWMFIYADLRGFMGGETGGVSHLAHLTGFLSIALLFYLMNKEERNRLRTGLWINISSFTAFLIAAYYLRGT